MIWEMLAEGFRLQIKVIHSPGDLMYSMAGTERGNVPCAGDLLRHLVLSSLPREKV